MAFYYPATLSTRRRLLPTGREVRFVPRYSVGVMVGLAIMFSVVCFATACGLGGETRSAGSQ